MFSITAIVGYPIIDNSCCKSIASSGLIEYTMFCLGAQASTEVFTSLQGPQPLELK